MKRLGDGGFTLLELMIAITLLAGMVAVLSQGFNLSIRVWEAAERRIDGHYSVTEAVNMFNREIKTSRKVYAYDPADNSRRLAFVGNSTSLTYVTPSPRLASGPNVSGLYLQRIVYRPEEKGFLFFEIPFWSIYTPDMEMGEPIEIGFGKIDDFSFEYLVPEARRVGEREEVPEYSWVSEVNLNPEGSFGEDMPNIFPERVRIMIKVLGDGFFVWPSQEIRLFNETGADVVAVR
ncbi:MAG: prepilin-type N-terminal cleavage/methylation domain-containing protein [Nitrospinota bacterium]|nr:prepilin-type N-terminal cleavage/methylation domain-containing protein [Nitrospinota bacterium]